MKYIERTDRDRRRPDHQDVDAVLRLAVLPEQLGDVPTPMLGVPACTTKQERYAFRNDKRPMISGELRRTCRIGRGLQVGGGAIEIFKGIGIEELAAPQ